MLDRLNFAGQFLLLSVAILVIGMATIGFWVQSAVERAVISRTAGVTALYVDSFVSPLIQDLPAKGELTAADRAELDRLIGRTSLGSQVVSFKIWSPQGEILYSPNANLVGLTFEVDEHLSDAFRGEVVSAVSDLTEPENEYEQANWETLIETYAPIRSEGSGAVFAVSEFYQLPDALIAEVRSAQLRGWLIVGGATLIMYLLLVGMARRASNTIRAQRSELVDNVSELRSALEENRRLQARVNKAAARTTTLNERFLRRVSADIHDGPAQDVALALLRIEHIAGALEGNGEGSRDDVETLRKALDSALADLRAITHGLRSPSVEGLSPCQAARRAVTDFERISGESVLVACEGGSAPAPLPVNITIYRIVQESLANSYKHAGAALREVRVTAADGHVDVEILDDGSGFDPTEASGAATLGLVGMRERVELLGGSFTVESQRDEGTVVRAVLPLTLSGTDA